MKQEANVNNNIEYRSFGVELRSSDDSDKDSYYIHGIPIVFNKATCLFEDAGVKYYEMIDSHAFDDCIKDDVILNYNHSGRVLARMSNGTLELQFNQDKVEMKAYLGGTDYGRSINEDIKGKYITKMSFAFEVADSTYDPNTHTRTITHIKRLYDVSVVDIPAYEDTEVSARNYFGDKSDFFVDKNIEKLKQEILIKSRI